MERRRGSSLSHSRRAGRCVQDGVATESAPSLVHRRALALGESGGTIVRRLNVSTLVTLDGVVQDPGGFGETDAGGWADRYFDDEAGRIAYQHALASDEFLLGRETYELFKAYWSQVHEGDYAARINSMPKLVASTTLHEPLEWNAILITGDIADEIKKIKNEDGGGILLYGSPTLMRTLAAHDLVDEYKIWIHPIVLGHGKQLFADGFDQTALQLVDVTALSTGVVILTYEPSR
jgi:dihydrofolate reductase